MGKKLQKTNAVRLLDGAKVSYELLTYEVDPNSLAATKVAEQLGQDVAQLFKTLVLRGDRNGIFVCIIPGDLEVDLKKAAKVSGNKSAEMIAMKELLPTTGYIRGACSPLGMKRHFPTFIHPTCLDFDAIFISAGVRGMQIKVDARELIPIIKAELAELTLG